MNEKAIYEEKQENLNPEVRPGFKKTALGWIPEDWRISTIGESFKICNNLRFPISEEVRKEMKGIYPYYGPTKIQDYIDEYRVEGKYALIGEDGDHFLKWKELPMTLLANGKFNVNNHAHLVQGNEDTITEWFLYYFQHRELTPFLTRQGAGRYKLTKESLTKIPIPIPKKSEQTAIANLLSTWDTAITKLQALIAAKEQRKKWLMQQLLTGKKRLPGFEGEWRKICLGEIGEFKTSSVDKILVQGEIIVNLVNYMDVYRNTVITRILKLSKTSATEREISTFNIKKGDILFTPSSETPDDIGHSALVTEDFQNTLYSYHLVRFRIFNDDLLAFAFREYVFNNQILLNEFSKRATGSTRYTLSKQDFEEATTKIPISLDEQIEIAKVLKIAGEEIEIEREKLNKLKVSKKGLMQQLLTGKLRLN